MKDVSQYKDKKREGGTYFQLYYYVLLILQLLLLFIIYIISNFYLQNIDREKPQKSFKRQAMVN